MTDGPHGTDLLLRTEPAGALVLAVRRVLTPDQAGTTSDAPGIAGAVTAGWRLPDGTTARGPFVVVHDREAL